VSLDSNWCYTYVNKKAGEFLGKKPRRLVGKHIWTEFPEGEGLPFYEGYRKAVKTNQTQILQEYYEPYDKWYESRIYPSKEGLTIYFTDVTEKKKAELALKESENYLRTILEIEPESIKQLNNKGELMYINPSGLAMIEADSLETVKGTSVLNLVTPNHKQAFKKLIADVFKGANGQLVFEIKGLKGTSRWLEIQAVPFKDTEGNLISFLGVTRDITNRKISEDQIIKSEKLFRHLSSNAPVAIFQTDKAGSCNYVNEEWIKYAGMSFNEAMGYGWANAIHPEDRERVMREWQQSVLDENEFVSEFRFLDKNNKITWLAAKAVGTFDAQNNLYGYIGMALDITEQKQSEKRLKESKVYLNNIINNIGDPVFVKDEHSHFLLANDAFYKIFNRRKEEILGKTFAEDVPKEERERYLNVDRQVIAEGVENIDEDSFEGKGGDMRFISTKKTRFVDASGKKYLIGVIRDITKQKTTEKLLSDSKNYLDNIINNIGDPLFVKDDQSRLIIVNDAFCEIFNLDRKDVIGKTLAENVSPEEQEIFLRIDKQVMNTGIENVNEETLTLKGKEKQIISTKKTRFIDASGNKFLIGIIRDITTRKKEAIELEKHRNKLEELIKIRTEEVNLKNEELKRMNKLFVGRELRMKELKTIIKEMQLKNED
jgi:PAS domain S-box-containing protein